MFALVHDTFEESRETPAVRHVFVGKTAEKAKQLYEVHQKSDAFIRECTHRGNFEGKLLCSTRQKMSRVTPKQLAALKNQQLAGAAVHGLSDIGACPPPSFWRFAMVVAVGQVAGVGTGWVIKRLMRNNNNRTTETAVAVGSLSAFWLASGIAWIALARRKPDTRTEPTAEATVPGKTRI